MAISFHTNVFLLFISALCHWGGPSHAPLSGLCHIEEAHYYCTKGNDTEFQTLCIPAYLCLNSTILYDDHQYICSYLNMSEQSQQETTRSFFAIPIRKIGMQQRKLNMFVKSQASTKSFYLKVVPLHWGTLFYLSKNRICFRIFEKKDIVYNKNDVNTIFGKKHEF